jgi:hypothetical protein
MKNSLVAFASASAILLGLSTQLAGCACEQQQTEEGTTVTVCEPITIFEGTPVDRSVAYTTGMGLEIDGANGSVDVKVGGSGEVKVTFQPVSGGGSDDADQARSEMENDLTLIAEDRDGTVYIAAQTADGSNPYLGARITVTVPSDFSGGVDVFNDNGSADVNLGGTAPTAIRMQIDNGGLTLRGAAGDLDVNQGNGTSCDVSIAGWGAANGTIACDSIDSEITIGSGLSGNITVVSQNGLISDPNPLPSDWLASEQNVDNSKSFSFGADAATASTVAITNDGDILLDAN